MELQLDVTSLKEEIVREVAALISAKQENPGSTPWLNVKSAARYLGMSEEAMRGLIKRREVEVHRPNGRVFINRKNLDSWVIGKDIH